MSLFDPIKLLFNASSAKNIDWEVEQNNSPNSKENDYVYDKEEIVSNKKERGPSKILAVFNTIRKGLMYRTDFSLRGIGRDFVYTLYERGSINVLHAVIVDAFSHYYVRNKTNRNKYKNNKSQPFPLEIGQVLNPINLLLVGSKLLKFGLNTLADLVDFVKWGTILVSRIFSLKPSTSPVSLFFFGGYDEAKKLVPSIVGRTLKFLIMVGSTIITIPLEIAKYAFYPLSYGAGYSIYGAYKAAVVPISNKVVNAASSLWDSVKNFWNDHLSKLTETKNPEKNTKPPLLLGSNDSNPSINYRKMDYISNKTKNFFSLKNKIGGGVNSFSIFCCIKSFEKEDPIHHNNKKLKNIDDPNFVNFADYSDDENQNPLNNELKRQ